MPEYFDDCFLRLRLVTANNPVILSATDEGGIDIILCPAGVNGVSSEHNSHVRMTIEVFGDENVGIIARTVVNHDNFVTKRTEFGERFTDIVQRSYDVLRLVI